jgi:hypothetical protein
MKNSQKKKKESPSPSQNKRGTGHRSAVAVQTTLASKEEERDMERALDGLLAEMVRRALAQGV